MSWLFSRSFFVYLFLLTTQVAQAYEPAALIREPKPFRDDGQIIGRDFEFTTTGFLNRFSYRFRPEWNEQWHTNPQGYRITAGSVRSDELYVVQHLNKSLTLNDIFVGHIRHRRDEDFDGRFDSTQVGLGVTPGHAWSLSVLSDIVATKEDIDLQFEIAWQDKPGTRFRLAFVAVDYFFNDKQGSAEYDEAPYTIFVEAHKTLSKNFRVGGSLNWNPRLRLVQQDTQGHYEFEQLVTEGYMQAAVSTHSSFFLSVKAEFGKSENVRFTTEESFDFSRENVVADFAVRSEITKQVATWVGLRYFLLNEDRAEQSHNTLKRREPTAHTGLQWRINENWLFWPGVYISRINKERRELDSQQENDQQVHARLSLPLEYAFSDSALATVNPTLEAPDGLFGGLNVQFQIHF